MTQDEIIRMAREAGFEADEANFIFKPKNNRIGIQLELERFAALVAAHEREWVELTVSDLDAIIEKHYDDEMDLKAMILDGIAAFKEKNRV
mgnify:CR=1 FL=1